MCLAEPDQERELREKALRLLARREHSERELIGKLVAKGAAAELARATVEELAREGLVSDERYAEALVRSRAERGYGPFRLIRELKTKGVADTLIERAVAPGDPRWLNILDRERSKKFGRPAPASYQEWARQARFLQGRGFSTEQIRQVLPNHQE